MESREAIRYFLVGLIVVTLVNIFFVLGGPITGYVMYGDLVENQSEVILTEPVDNSSDYTQEMEILPEGDLKLITIKEITPFKNGLNITYYFDNSNLIGDMLTVKIWIVNEELSEINISDTININQNSPIKRNVFMNLSEDLVGEYDVYFALFSDLENFTKKSVVFGDLGITGNVVLEDTKSKFGVYVVFLFVIGIFVFYIWRRGKKETLSKPKNKRLLNNKNSF